MKIEEKQLLKALLSIPANNVFYFENLENRLSFRPKNCFCKCLVECKTPNALLQTLRILKNPNAHAKTFKQTPIKHYILGNGSNTIVADFYNGYLVKLGENFKKIKRLKSHGDHIQLEVGAGVNMFVLNNYLKQKGIGGLEWSYGIPGSVGGAVIMNAGAFGEEFGKFVKKVKILKHGKYIWVDSFKFAYRNSNFKKDKSIVVAVVLQLNKSNSLAVEEGQKYYLEKRKSSQPYEYASAGSVFKRIIKKDKIIYPAKLIDNLGLKGVTIGQAEVSTKHSGFIVNLGNASGCDYVRLAEKLKTEVREKHGITLECEVEILE